MDGVSRRPWCRLTQSCELLEEVDGEDVQLKGSVFSPFLFLRVSVNNVWPTDYYYCVGVCCAP